MGGSEQNRNDPQALEQVLASIRALVSAETNARLTARPDAEADDEAGAAPGARPVLMLTAEMRVEAEPVRMGELLADGAGPRAVARPEPAPILDEEALRAVVNRIVREELQGELGDRISRNLRKLIRREIGQLIDERKED